MGISFPLNPFHFSFSFLPLPTAYISSSSRPSSSSSSSFLLSSYLLILRFFLYILIVPLYSVTGRTGLGLLLCVCSQAHSHVNPSSHSPLGRPLVDGNRSSTLCTLSRLSQREQSCRVASSQAHLKNSPARYQTSEIDIYPPSYL